MDILKILEESRKSLYIEDLDFFETELATGGPYSDEYKTQCKDKIKEIRLWMSSDSPNEAGTNPGVSVTGQASPELVVGIHQIAPEINNPVAAAMKPEDMIFNDIKAMRKIGSYKSGFKKYVLEHDVINAAFVDAHCSFFRPEELDAIVSIRQMGEAFLEKYFGAIDHDKIARYQLFSESFFMKHFAQMDASIVLEHGKNEWRKKENRSRQLDVFLRLKGVKI